MPKWQKYPNFLQMGTSLVFCQQKQQDSYEYTSYRSKTLSSLYLLWVSINQQVAQVIDPSWP